LLYEGQGKYEQAERYYQRAVAHLRAGLGFPASPCCHLSQ
jgi:hypothetical protein